MCTLVGIERQRERKEGGKKRGKRVNLVVRIGAASRSQEKNPDYGTHASSALPSFLRAAVPPDLLFRELISRFMHRNETKPGIPHFPALASRIGGDPTPWHTYISVCLSTRRSVSPQGGPYSELAAALYFFLAFLHVPLLFPLHSSLLSRARRLSQRLWYMNCSDAPA